MHFLRINAPLLGVAAALTATIVLAVASGSPDAGPGTRAADTTLPDFREFRAGPERKTEFFTFLRPILSTQNEKILEDRERLEKIARKGEAGWRDRGWLEDLARYYDVPLESSDGGIRSLDALLADLMLRVDAVPESLALAQAAKESGWGTSRFAREGNNLFGEWCFSDGCGIVPSQRAPGRSHEVEAFRTPAASVASYLRNINTHDSYASFRRARKAQREAQGKLSGVALAAELSQYSERREAYVNELRRLIIGNDLEKEEAGQPDES